MDSSEMEQRRSAALDALQTAIDEIGPITDETRHSIREPLLEIIEQVDQAGSTLQELEFEGQGEPSGKD